MMARDRRRAGRHPLGGDAGTSLIEMLVSLGIMSVVMALVTQGILQISQAVRRTDAIADAQDQGSRAVDRITVDIGYAFTLIQQDVTAGPCVAYTARVTIAGQVSTAPVQRTLCLDTVRRELTLQGPAALSGGCPTKNSSGVVIQQTQLLATGMSAVSGTPALTVGLASGLKTLTIVLRSTAGGSAREIRSSITALNSASSTSAVC